MATVETRYAQARDGTHIAYQVSGDGPLDIVFMRGWLSQIEHEWDERVLGRVLRRLGSMGRLIRFDRRGSGLSDRRGTEIPTIEERVDDVLSVMDAAGSTQAVFIGLAQGGFPLAVTAAAHPSRCAGLILYAPTARGRWADDYPWGMTDERFETFASEVRGLEPRDMALRLLRSGAPSRSSAGRADDADFIAWLAEDIRLSGSADEIVALARVGHETDIRDALRTIRLPTLVLARDPGLEEARVVAGLLGHARLVALTGPDHMLIAGDTDAALREMESFIHGLGAASQGQDPDFDRVLATVLFTDIVDSTGMALELGDRAWAARLEEHQREMRHLVAAYRGVVIDIAGDGLLASFDGPGRAIRCAAASVVRSRDAGMEIRAGLHTGECERVGTALRGVAVHVGARVMATAGPSQVLVTGTVRDLVAGSGLSFEERGQATLKGLPGRWPIFEVDLASASAG